MKRILIRLSRDFRLLVIWLILLSSEFGNLFTAILYQLRHSSRRNRFSLMLQSVLILFRFLCVSVLILALRIFLRSLMTPKTKRKLLNLVYCQLKSLQRMP